MEEGKPSHRWGTSPDLTIHICHCPTTDHCATLLLLLLYHNTHTVLSRRSKGWTGTGFRRLFAWWSCWERVGTLTGQVAAAKHLRAAAAT